MFRPVVRNLLLRLGQRLRCGRTRTSDSRRNQAAEQRFGPDLGERRRVARHRRNAISVADWRCFIGMCVCTVFCGLSTFHRLLRIQHDPISYSICVRLCVYINRAPQQPRDYHHNQQQQQHQQHQHQQHHHHHQQHPLHHQQSPTASNASTPTSSHPYAPLQSPTFSISNTSNRYADLGDIFSEVGDMTATPPSAMGGVAAAAAHATSNNSKLHNRQQSSATPTSATSSSIAIPRPPSRRSESVARGRISPATISRADSVGSLEFRTASIGLGSSRGPSPLTIGMSDTIPLAVAFHEVVHAYFR